MHNSNLKNVSKLLPDPSVNINSKNSYREMPLSLADKQDCISVNGNLEKVNKLLSDPSVNINSKNSYREMPLSLADKQGYINAIRPLRLCEDIYLNKDK